jgi:adenylate cyclase
LTAVRLQRNLSFFKRILMSNDIRPASVNKRVSAILAAAITIVFFVLAFFHLDLDDSFPVTRLDWLAVDAKFRFRDARPRGEDVVIVGIDDVSLAKLGSARLFQRTNYATLITKLAAAEPKAIGLDITFSEADFSDPDNDREFAQAIQAANSVVLGVFLQLEKRVGPKRPLEDLDPEMVQLIQEKGIFAAERIEQGNQPPMAFILADKREGNVPELTKAAVSFGFLNFHPDSDGKLRYQPQIIEYGGRLYPSLDIQLLRKYLDAPSPIIGYGPDGSIQTIEIGRYRIPTDRFGRLLVDYTGPAGMYKTVSMVDVIEDRVNREVFKDKIVLIGAVALGLKDVVPTPFDPTLPGVELHANVIDNILHERFIYRRSLTEGFIDLASILIFGILLGYLLPKWNAKPSVLLSIVMFVGFAIFNYWTFVRLHWFLSFAYPGLSLVVTSFGLISYKYLTEEREKKRTRQTFQYYLDPLVVEQVMRQPELLKLGGEKRELSVMFSDIRGFTSFSEKMAPAEVVHFLNQYFEKMHAIIWKNKGTLDKLIGDAVMCFWGAPLETKDHALRGVVTALEMIQAVEDLRGVLVLPGGGRFDIGIGVNTGQMVIGNMGSPSRLSYTVMGDNVNLASRLESLNKYYGTKIIISDSTYEEVRNVVFCRQLDTIQVKGKSSAVTIYEPMGLRRLEFDRRHRGDRRGPMTLKKRLVKVLIMLRHGERRQEDRRLGSAELLVKPEQEEIKTMYEHALELYRKGDFDGAEIGFDHVLSLNPSDGPSRLMKDRVAKYREEHAGAQTRFDPVYRFDEK